MTDDTPDSIKETALQAVATMGRPKRSTRQERLARLLDLGDATQDDPRSILYSHSVLCQTCLPYRNPGENVLAWEQANGGVRLKVKAGEALDPRTDEFVQLGLPYGPKPRLIMAHLNAEALRQGSATIEVEDSLTAFVKRLGLDGNGRDLRTIKDQLARLSAAHIVLGVARDGRAVTIKQDIISAFDLWFPTDGQRVLWPSTVKLSAEYFESLKQHAVPLHDKALAALSGNAMALDVYAWLAQRLHRIEAGKRVFIPWPALQAQFGSHYGRLDNFKRVFTQTVKLVHGQYRAADIELDRRRGMTLRHSPPPVKGRYWSVSHIP